MAEIEGLDELARQLDGLVLAVDGKNLRGALLDGGEVLREQVQRNIKQQGLYETGELHDSILSEALDDANVVVGVPPELTYRAKIYETGGIIKAKRADYLHFQVNGRWVKIKATRRRKRPFLKPAARGQSARQVLDEVRTALVVNLVSEVK